MREQRNKRKNLERRAERRGEKRRRVRDVMGSVYRRRGISSINACRLKTTGSGRDILHDHLNTAENMMARISLSSTSMTSVGGMNLLIGENVGFCDCSQSIYLTVYGYENTTSITLGSKIC